MEILKVTIPPENGYSYQLKMLSRVQDDLNTMGEPVTSAKIRDYTNPFFVDIEPDKATVLVGLLLRKSYGFNVDKA